jgi:signal transduction histidine kinase
MSNSSSNTSTSSDTGADLFVTYYPFTLVIVGTLFNFFTCAIFFRPTFRDTNKRPVLHYMRAVTIFDILMLYGWNLDHYLYGAFGFTLNQYSVASCKITFFLKRDFARISTKYIVTVRRYVLDFDLWYFAWKVIVCIYKIQSIRDYCQCSVEK